MNRTYTPKKGTTQRKWYVVDATGIPVGRLASQVAQILRGKHKPTFTYNQDEGDFVVIINAEKAIWTGNKNDEIIYWHTGFPGGLRNATRGFMMEEKPVKMIEKVVWGMLPKHKLGRRVFSKLKVYTGSEHPHIAQQPEALSISKEGR